MPDPSTPLSDEAVEAAAKAAYELGNSDNDESWEEAKARTPVFYRDRLARARAALVAAAPFMLIVQDDHQVCDEALAEAAAKIVAAEHELNAYAEALPEAHDRVDAAEARAKALEAQIERVRELHQLDKKPAILTVIERCKCGRQWPCPTIAALGSTETREGE